MFMGVYTAAWKALIEACVDFIWKDVPEMLLTWGVFTDVDGSFPIYHYMWIVPAFFGGTLSYVFAALPTPIPGQNEWIHNLHSRGVQSADTFVPLFLLSTAGMASGLSLGPELPLILTAGMIGSWLGVLCKQSMLQARVLNLTAASAAIGGFFGFPMAGALFVLEIPHRMGLQYFEALSPATIASIVAVLTNRLVTGNDVSGYYEYPFLNESLPSQIFKDAIVYGLFGGALGIFYTKVVLVLKDFVHGAFKTEPDHHHAGHNQSHRDKANHLEETIPLVGNPELNVKKEGPVRQDPLPNLFACTIPHEPTRAAVSGTLVGLVVGTTCMFIPHVMFWGEAQLQSLIDKGRTPLPVFGRGDEPSAGLVALGYCMIDQEGTGNSGFSLGCSAAIALAKIFVTGLSLGTGIVGGHFWAPLFVGCASSHFFTDLVGKGSAAIGFSTSLSAYPCVALLCIMGSTHVVTCKCLLDDAVC
jgi:H+/Cl- antiporter ClcA